MERSGRHARIFHRAGAALALAALLGAAGCDRAPEQPPAPPPPPAPGSAVDAPAGPLEYAAKPDAAPRA